MSTTIEWTNERWNPVRGCSLVSAGCANCYAMRQAHRFSGSGKPYDGLTEIGPQGPRWTGKIRLVPELLDAPLHWEKPRRIFVDSMSDLFHDDVPDEFIVAVFGVMAAAMEHTFQVLTKRPDRMRTWFSWLRDRGGLGPYIRSIKIDGNRTLPNFFHATARTEVVRGKTRRSLDDPWMKVLNAAACIGSGPLPNVWLGVSVEDQLAADQRIPILLQTPAAVRWISAEPLLGPIDLTAIKRTRAEGFMRPLDGRFRTLDWVVIGGESGPGARPCNIEWIRSIVSQCQAADVPCFVKQLGRVPYVDRELTGWPAKTLFSDAPNGMGGYVVKLGDNKGGDPSEWPSDLRVRAWPR